MKKGRKQQAQRKSRESLGNTLKNLYSNKLENLEKNWQISRPCKIELRGY
jgi:hypothetical protein